MLTRDKLMKALKQANEKAKSYSLKVTPPTEGSQPKTRKEHCKRRTNTLPLATR